MSPLHELRGSKKKQIFKRVNEVYGKYKVSCPRRLFGLIMEEYHIETGIPDELKEPYLYVIKKILKESK